MISSPRPLATAAEIRWAWYGLNLRAVQLAWAMSSELSKWWPRSSKMSFADGLSPPKIDESVDFRMSPATGMKFLLLVLGLHAAACAPALRTSTGDEYVIYKMKPVASREVVKKAAEAAVSAAARAGEARTDAVGAAGGALMRPSTSVLRK